MYWSSLIVTPSVSAADSWILWVSLCGQSRPTLRDQWAVATRLFFPWVFLAGDWSGLPFPAPGRLPNSGTEATSPVLAGRLLAASATSELQSCNMCISNAHHQSLYECSLRQCACLEFLLFLGKFLRKHLWEGLLSGKDFWVLALWPLCVSVNFVYLVWYKIIGSHFLFCMYFVCILNT